MVLDADIGILTGRGDRDSAKPLRSHSHRIRRLRRRSHRSATKENITYLVYSCQTRRGGSRRMSDLDLCIHISDVLKYRSTRSGRTVAIFPAILFAS